MKDAIPALTATSEIITVSQKYDVSIGKREIDIGTGILKASTLWNEKC